MMLMELREEFRLEMTMCGTVQNTDYKDAKPIEVWNMTAVQLKRNPQCYSAVHAYYVQIQKYHLNESFYYNHTLSKLDAEMRNDQGGKLPVCGFMK